MDPIFTQCFLDGIILRLNVVGVGPLTEDISCFSPHTMEGRISGPYAKSEHSSEGLITNPHS
jgi:hypothetical protein